MASDPQTAATATYQVLSIVLNHISEQIDFTEQLLNMASELRDAQEKLQNRVQQSEEDFITGVRLATDTILAMGDQERAEQRVDDLEEFQKEL